MLSAEPNFGRRLWKENIQGELKNGRTLGRAIPNLAVATPAMKRQLGQFSPELEQCSPAWARQIPEWLWSSWRGCEGHLRKTQPC